MGKLETKVLGTFAATATGAAFDVSHLDNIVVTWTGSYTGSFYLETSTDGTVWAPVPDFAAAHTANLPGRFQIPCAVRYIRGRFARSGGTLYAHFAGRVRPKGRVVVGSLGDFTTASTGTGVDVSNLESVCVIWGGTYVADLAVDVNAVGTVWSPAPNYTQTPDTAGAYKLTVPARLIRARCTTRHSGTVSVSYVGLDLDR